MAHEITITNGKAEAAFGSNTPAWHGLGQVVSGLMKSSEALELAGLDWTVEQWPLRAFEDPNAPDTGRVVTVPRKVANVRSDTGSVLGVVGETYTPVQNSKAFEFFDALVADKLAMYESAGSLKGGRLVWMLARIPQEHRAAKEDTVLPYVLLVNSHDGSSALRMIPTAVRVVCWNTLSLAIGSRGAGEGISIRHFGSLDARISDARRALKIAAASFDEFDEQMHQLIAADCTESDFTTYVDDIFPDNSKSEKNKWIADQRKEKLVELFHDPKQMIKGIEGSWWSAMNAVTEYVDHHAKQVGDPTERADRRMQSTMLNGPGAKIKSRALHVALDYAGA